MRKLFILGALLATVLAHGQGRTYLNIGDKAPELKPAKWLKGTPVANFAKGKVYVVEFWATWCGPCKENIPHLTEMAKKYAGKFKQIPLSTIDDTFGGWQKAQATHFADGGVFDRIYRPK